MIWLNSINRVQIWSAEFYKYEAYKQLYLKQIEYKLHYLKRNRTLLTIHDQGFDLNKCTFSLKLGNSIDSKSDGSLMHNALMNKICTSNIQLKHWANVILICYLGCTSERKSKRINTSLFFRVPFNDFESIMNTLILSYQDVSFYVYLFVWYIKTGLDSISIFNVLKKAWKLWCEFSNERASLSNNSK